MYVGEEMFFALKMYVFWYCVWKKKKIYDFFCFKPSFKEKLKRRT